MELAYPVRTTIQIVIVQISMRSQPSFIIINICRPQKRDGAVQNEIYKLLKWINYRFRNDEV